MFIQVSGKTDLVSLNDNKFKILDDINGPLKEREETLEKSVASSSHWVLIFCKTIVVDDEYSRASCIPWFSRLEYEKQ